jgi:hypothetical protein
MDAAPKRRARAPAVANFPRVLLGAGGKRAGTRENGRTILHVLKTKKEISATPLSGGLDGPCV